MQKTAFSFALFLYFVKYTLNIICLFVSITPRGTNGISKENYDTRRQWGTSISYMMGPTSHYDVIEVAPLGNKHNIDDVIMTSLSYHVTSSSSSFLWKNECRLFLPV